MSGGAGFWAVVMVFELWFWFCFNTLVDSHNVFLPPQLVLVLPAWFHLVKFHQSWICQGFISRDIIWCNVIWTSQFLNYVRSAVRRLANNYLSVLNYCKLISIASGYCGCLDFGSSKLFFRLVDDNLSPTSQSNTTITSRLTSWMCKYSKSLSIQCWCQVSHLVLSLSVQCIWNVLYSVSNIRDLHVRT